MPTTAARVNPGRRRQAAGRRRREAAGSRRPAPKARVRRGSEENAAPNGQYTEGVYANRAAKAPAARRRPSRSRPASRRSRARRPPPRRRGRRSEAPAPAQRPARASPGAGATPEAQAHRAARQGGAGARAARAAHHDAKRHHDPPITTKTTREVRLGRASSWNRKTARPSAPSCFARLRVRREACASSWKPRLKSMGDPGRAAV